MRSKAPRRASRQVPNVSLERALSKLGLATRTQARQMIANGLVRVRGRVVRDPGYKVVPEKAGITIVTDGAETRAERQAPVTVLLHKPKGVVTTRSDEKGRPTVYSLLEGLGCHVIPVGRLDMHTTGLLLLTNDTRFAAWITDPRNEVPRTYVVTVRGELSDEEIRRLTTQGVADEGELLRARSIRVLKRSTRETHVEVELTEGKNREIRRMFLALDHEVTKLARVRFGGLELGALEPGRWRKLTSAELKRAFPQAPVR